VLKHLSPEVAGSKRQKESASIKTSLRWAVSTIRLRLDLHKKFSGKKISRLKPKNSIPLFFVDD